jgi:diguanylate cyclase (GGDEF)-like protein
VPEQPLTAAAAARPDRGLMARSLMYLFGLAGIATLISLLGDPSPRAAVIGGTSMAIAFALLALYDRMPDWGFDLFLACGSVMVEWAVYAGGSRATTYSLLLFWIAIYAFYFLPRWRAGLQLGLIGLTYAAIIAIAPDRSSAVVLNWAVTTAALIVAGALIGAQRAHMARVVRRLADDARRDTLTGLMNRRGFEELFETELERARRSGESLSVIVADLDKFKALNDKFGHQAGDRALEKVGQVLDQAKRRIDTVARLGGEEFAVLVPSSDHHAAYILAERMRRSVRDAFATDPTCLTISLGVAAFPIHGAAPAALIHGADQSLYAAKRLGRDRSVVYSEDIAGTLAVVDGQPADGGPDLHRDTVLALAQVIDSRDGDGEQSQRVGRYAAAIAEALGLPVDVVERVRFAGIVHDIGKIGIPDAVLGNPGWLEEADWAEVQRHPEIAARILRGANFEDVSIWVHAHNERLDGSGYPRGLTGEAIPLEARIIAVASAYEAMCSDRAYRAAMPPADARSELSRGAGTQFDGRVVETFLSLLQSGLAEGDPHAEAAAA